MNKLIQCVFKVIAITFVFVACDKKDDWNGTELPYKPASKDAQMANQINLGFSSGDETAIFFSHFEEDGLKLYRKDRQTGVLTVLDEIVRPEDKEAEMTYTHLHSSGDHLYYMPYDVSTANRKNRLWRMKKDGTQKILLSEKEIFSCTFKDERIYYSTIFGENAFWSMNLDGSDNRKIMSITPAHQVIKNELIYYCDYTHEGGFHGQLIVSNLDGSSSKVLYDSQSDLRFVLTENNKLYCLDISNNHCRLVVMNIDGSEQKTVLTDIPFGNLNISDNTLLIACIIGNNNYKAGIYRYEEGYKMLMPILQVPTTYISLVGNDQIVYANGNDKENAGRFWQLYITDINGKGNKKLID